MIYTTPVKLFNSTSGQLQEFISLKPGEISLYVCGITPYDTTHLGHAFTYIFFDVLRRYLMFKGYNVSYTQNVTDIDDDILRKAKELKTDWKRLGDSWIYRFVTDMKALNILPPTSYIKATEAIDEIITMNIGLQQKGFAYENEGNLYFNIAKFSSYGNLSKFTRDEMITLSKERGADPSDTRKKDPLDFILWQKSTEGEPSWDSPWGNGRPGWHIECSAMIYKTLGIQIDIHGGGNDLIYPHHESEIAQSETFTGVSPFVAYWIHTGMVEYTGEKMAKSVGNLIMVHDLLQTYSANTIRYYLLSHHYRSSWEFDASELSDAEEKVIKILNSNALGDHDKFIQAIEEDFNIPLALTFAGREELALLGFKDV